MLSRVTTAVTYLRVSSLDQVQNTSLDSQDERTKKLLAEKGWRHLATFREEGRSAKDDDRPQLKAMLKFCQENEVDYVVSLDMSRLSRDTETFLRIRKSLAAAGTRLSFTSFDPGDSPEGIFIATVTAAASELENRLRGQKAKRGMLETKKAGGWTTKAPKGYRCVRVGRLPSLEPDDNAHAVYLAFEDVAAGRRTMAEAARSIGISKWLDFFRQPVYAGYNTLDGELVKGSWKAIVPLATWYRVQDRMKHRPHVKQTDFWLRGQLRCECGQMLTASYSKGRHKKYGYYHCRRCKARHPARELENAFKDWLDELASTNRQVLIDAKRSSAVATRRLLEVAQEENRRTNEEAARISAQLSSLIDLQLSDGITREEYDAKRAELVAKRDQLRTRIALGAATEDECLRMLDDAAYILDHFNDFLGTAGHEDLMIVVRALVGSTTDVSGSGKLSNRENDGLYWLNSLLCHSNVRMAPLGGEVSNRVVASRLRVSRTIVENVLGA